MKTSTKIMIIGGSIVTALMIFAIILGSAVIGMYNGAIATEKSLFAQYEQAQNNLGQYTLKVMESVQVPDMYKDDLKEVIREAISGKYGKDGAQAVWLWSQDQQIQFDSSLYKQIQTLIESGRNKFEDEQKKVIDQKRGYETMLGQFPSNIVLEFFEFPKRPLSDIKIVISEEAKEAFRTGVQAPMQLKK